MKFKGLIFVMLAALLAACAPGAAEFDVSVSDSWVQPAIAFGETQPTEEFEDDGTDITTRDDFENPGIILRRMNEDEDRTIDQITEDDQETVLLYEGQAATAAFVTINNSGGTVNLTDASSPVAEEVLLIRSEGNRWNEVDSVAISAGGTFVMQPGETFLLLTGLQQTLDEGASVSLTLTFENGNTVTTEAIVANITP